MHKHIFQPTWMHKCRRLTLKVQLSLVWPNERIWVLGQKYQFFYLHCTIIGYSLHLRHTPNTVSSLSINICPVICLSCSVQQWRSLFLQPYFRQWCVQRIVYVFNSKVTKQSILANRNGPQLKAFTRLSANRGHLEYLGKMFHLRALVWNVSRWNFTAGVVNIAAVFHRESFLSSIYIYKRRVQLTM